MIRLTNLADYAVVLSGRLAREPGRQMNAAELSADTGLPVPTVSKILGMLSRGGILDSQRGLKGGFKLAKPADEISLLCIIEVVDGRIELTECMNETGGCCQMDLKCEMRPHWAVINNAVRSALADVKLSQVLGGDVEHACISQSMRGLADALQPRN